MEINGAMNPAGRQPLYPLREREREESELAELVTYFGFNFVSTPDGWKLADPDDAH